MAKGDKKKSPNPEPVPTECFNQVGVSVWCDDPNGSANAVGTITPDSYPAIQGVHESAVRIMFNIPQSVPWPDWGYTISIKSPGYIPIEFRIDPKIDGQSFDVTLHPVAPNFTRDQICGSKVTLSGLMISTAQFGNQPWFELAYQCLSNPADRHFVRQQKIQAGDTGQIIEFFTNQISIYPDRPGNETWLGNCITQVGEFNQPLFKQFVEEILADGLVPIVVYDGDNGEDPNNGYPNALRQLPIVTALLSEYNDQILYARFWDGVFYGTTPEQIQNFGRQFRSLLPNGHLAIEFNPGHIPVGNGPADYEPGGMMTDYDVIVAEFDWPAPIQDPPAIIGAEWNSDHNTYIPVWSSNVTIWQNMWQVCGRLVENYKAPSNQPFNVLVRAVDGPQEGQIVSVSSDNYPAIYYLRTGNARGKYFFWAFECGEYEWVRYQNTADQLTHAGNYFRGMGANPVGMP